MALLALARPGADGVLTVTPVIAALLSWWLGALGIVQISAVFSINSDNRNTHLVTALRGSRADQHRRLRAAHDRASPRGAAVLINSAVIRRLCVS